MLEELTCACERSECGRELREEHLMLTMRTSGGVRRAYECTCGAVTVTVVDESLK